MIIKQVLSIEYGLYYYGRIIPAQRVEERDKIRYVGFDGTISPVYTFFKNKDQVEQLLSMVPDDIKI